MASCGAVPSRYIPAFHPILFAGYAVLLLYADNLDHTTPADLARPLLLALLFGVAALLVCAGLLSDVGAGAIVAAMVVALGLFLPSRIVGLVYIASYYVAPSAKEGLADPLMVAAFLFIGSAGITAAVILAREARRRNLVGSINGALTVAAVVLLAFPVVRVVEFIGAAPPPLAPAPSGLVAQRKSTRDIYYFILDRYGSNRALNMAFNVAQNDFPSWLEQRGFYVASDAHANYDRTTISIPATLNLDYLDEAFEQLDKKSSDERAIYELFQDHRMGRFLEEQGYKYVHLGNWYGPTSSVAIASRSLRYDGPSEFEAAVLDQTPLPALRSVIDPHAADLAVDQIHLDSARYQFAELNQIMAEPGPKFVLAHILLPHDPIVFNADGSYKGIPDRLGLPFDERFQLQLDYTNSAVEETVERLFDLPEEDRPIVVVQADEGPWPQRYRDNKATFDWTQATDEEIQAKYGILDAFYLPPEAGVAADAPEPYPTISSVNTWRLIFDRYFGTDLPLLPDRSYAPRQAAHPFDVFDVTDRLTATP